MSFFGKFSKIIEKLPFVVSGHAAPMWAGYLLNRKLERLEDEESISEFKTRVSRIGKHHYKMELELSLTEKQAREGFSDLIKNITTFNRGD